MKISKLKFKSLIKECLVELLAEGLGADSLNESITNVRRPSTQSRSTSTHPSKQKQQSSPRRSQDALEPQMRAAVDEVSKGNPELASILAETAMTTFREQSNGNYNDSGSTRQLDGVAGAIVNESTPEDLFGEDVASKWSELAFAPTARH